MGTVEEGARNLVKNCMGMKPSERALIVTDRSRLAVGKEILNAARKISKDSEMIILEDFGKRPFTKLPREIAKI